MRLLVTFLVAAVFRSQHAVSAQCSPQCSCGSPDGSWSPLYKILTAPQPSENDIVPRGPPRCSCGCSPRRLLPRRPSPPPHTAQQPYGISALSGVVVDSPVYQQMGPATVIQTPPATYVSSSDVQDSSPYTCDTSSHIMTIPRRQDSSATFTPYDTSSNTITTTDDSTPTITYSAAPDARPAEVFSTISDESPSTTYSTTPQQVSCQPPPSNSVRSEHQPNFSPPPRPIYFTQPAPLFASCPATLFYPAAPALTCTQPNFIYPASPSYISAPTVPSISQSFNPGTSSHKTYSTHENTPNTYSTIPSQDALCNALQAVPSTSQTFKTGTFQNTPSNTVTFGTSDTYQKPTNSLSFNTDCQNTPSNTVFFRDSHQEAPSNSQTFTTGTHQNTPSNTVTFSTSDKLQTPSNSGTCNSDFQHTPSNTVFFRDSDNTGGTGTLSPETAGPSVTTHDTPLTYTLLTSGTNAEVTDANRDCSVPVPPVLV